MNKQKWVLSLSIIAGAMGCISQSDSQVDQTQEITGILITGADQVNTGACGVYKIRPLNAQNQPVSVAQQVQFRLSSTGNGQTYLDAACENPSANVTIAQGDSSAEFYIQNKTLESFDIRYQGQAIKTIEVTTFSQLASQQLNGPVRDILPLRDGSGSIYIVGDFDQVGTTEFGGLARMFVQGEADASFEVGEGFARASGTLSVNELTYANNFSNDVYVAGNFNRYKGGTTPELVKIFGNGSLDTPLYNDFVSLSINKVFVVEDEALLVAGQFNEIRPCGTSFTSRAITKMTLGLDFDADFLNVPSMAALCDDVDLADNIPTYFNGSDEVNTIVEGPGNTVYVGGRINGYNDGVDHAISKIIRIDAGNGSLDTSFVPPDLNGRVFAIVPDDQGRLYVGGSFFNVGAGSDRDRLIRLTASGQEDPSFAIGTGFDGSVRALHQTDTGSIYVGGNFTELDGNDLAGDGLIRLLSDGTVDPLFNVGSGFNGTVYVVQPANDQSGDIFVGGDFTQYKGQPVNYLVRLSASGSID